MPKDNESSTASESTAEDVSLAFGNEGEGSDTSSDDSNASEESSFISSAQSIADSIDESSAEESEVDSLVDEILSESTDGDDSSSEASESEEGDESSESSDEQQSSNKDGFKKGLEKVQNQRDEALETLKQTQAEKTALEEKLAAFESKLDSLTEQKDVKTSQEAKKDEPTYTDKELADAIKTFISEDDPQGIMDVINYKVEQSQKAIRQEYVNEQKQRAEEATRKQVEWQTISKNYSPEGYENELVKEDADFDIRDAGSVLYKQAEQIYLDGVKKQNTRYTIAGGMSNAVQDAFVQLLQSKFGQNGNTKQPKKDEEAEGLKQRLAKEHRKNSLGSGASSKDGGGKTPTKPKKVDELGDYLSERSKAKNERMGSTI